jgi:hypothetical protein
MFTEAAAISLTGCNTPASKIKAAGRYLRGDIITDMNGVRCVFGNWISWRWFWCVYPNGNKILPYESNTEAIGNIYENSELLTNDKKPQSRSAGAVENRQARPNKNPRVAMARRVAVLPKSTPSNPPACSPDAKLPTVTTY